MLTPRIMTPTCPHCGGMRREFLRQNRRRLGMSFHRVCCCGCPAAVTVTFAGVDATVCSACVDNGTDSWEVTNLDIDGTHNVDFTGETSFSGDTFCDYGGSGGQGPIGDYTVDKWLANTTCAGASDETTVINVTVRVLLYKDDNSIRRVDAIEKLKGATGVVFQTDNFAKGVKTFGDALNNNVSCGVNFGEPNAASGGTATVQEA